MPGTGKDTSEKPNPPQIGAVYRFGDLDFEPARGLLRRAGREESLRQKCRDVLVTLIENRHRLVTKEELQALHWTEVVVADDAVVQCIVEIRRALGDDARSPRYVKTLPKAGYRFIGELMPEGETAGTAPAATAPVASAAAPPPLRSLALAAAVLIAASGVGLWALARRPGPPAPEIANAGETTANLEAYRLYELGVEAADSLHTEEALHLFRRALALDPTFAMAQARVGYVYSATLNEPDKGLPYLERAFRSTERLTQRDRRTIAGWYAIARRDYPGAVAAYRRLVAEFPTDVAGHVRLAGLLEAEEQPDEAEHVVVRAAELAPQSPEVFNRLATVRAVLGRHDDAIAAARRAVELVPGEPNVQDTLGLVLAWAGRNDEAIEAYHAAARAGPRFAPAARHLGNTYVKLGRYREALQAFERFRGLAASEVERAEALDAIACVYLRKRDVERAWAFAHEGLSAAPDLIWVPITVAARRGDRESLDSMAQRLEGGPKLSARGTRPSIRVEDISRGELALARGNTDEALLRFRDVLRHRPLLYNVETYEDRLAAVLLDLGRWDEAAAECERLIARDPGDALAHFRLSKASDHRGDAARARAERERFLALWGAADPDVPEVVEARSRR